MISPPAEKERALPTAWHNLPIGQVFARTGSAIHGLTLHEAERRLVLEGRNELKEARSIRPLRIFLRQFDSLIIWILLLAALISGFLAEWIDCAAILTIIALNAVIGFYQGFSAEKSIAALKKMTAPQTKVRRAGQLRIVPAAEIVRGDVIELEAGDLVAADARLVQASSMKCVESSLTGESEAVIKKASTLDEVSLPLGDRENMVFMGTSIATGQGCAVIVATGMDTEIGRIAGLLTETAGEQRSPLQKRLDAAGRILVWASLGIVALLFVLGVLRGIPFWEIFLTSISLAVAAVPEGLPAIVTVSLAVGVMRMARRRALVRTLPAVETLGSTNVICTDKTGTLTMGEMTVRQLYVAGHSYEVTGEGYKPHGEVLFEGKASDARHAAPLLELANVLVGCNNAQLVLEQGAWRVIGDPTEGAMLAVGHKAGSSPERVEKESRWAAAARKWRSKPPT